MAEEKYVPRLKTKYQNEVKQALHDKFQYENVMMIPKFEKIVVNMGVGEAATDSKAIEGAVRDLRAITGQQPMVTRARKSIATFHLRAGMPIGAKAVSYTHLNRRRGRRGCAVWHHSHGHVRPERGHHRREQGCESRGKIGRAHV